MSPPLTADIRIRIRPLIFRITALRTAIRAIVPIATCKHHKGNDTSLIQAFA
jgi:hypothetical protein